MQMQRSSLSRRDFVRTTLAGSVGLSLTALATADKAAEDFGGFKLGVQSYSFRSFNTEQALKRTQDLGLSFIEFYSKHADPKSTPQQINALLKMCSDYNVKPAAFGVQRFTKDHAANQKAFEFGKALGIKSFSADPDPDSFDSLDKLVEEYKIAIAIHPHGPTGGGKLHRWYSADTILKAVSSHHPLIGSCLDTGHLIRTEQVGEKLDPAAEVRKMGARNFGMHLKDHDNKKKTDVVYGKGVLDVASVLKALRDVKFAGVISIEYEANEAEPSPDMKACVDVFKKVARNLA